MESEARRRIGLRLKEVREARNLTQGSVADGVGVSLHVYKNWELGRSEYGPAQAQDLCAELSVEIADLFAPPGSPIAKPPPRRSMRETGILFPASSIAVAECMCCFYKVQWLAVG